MRLRRSAPSKDALAVVFATITSSARLPRRFPLRSKQVSLGTPLVSPQKEFCSGLRRSPQKEGKKLRALGRSRLRPATTSMWEKTSVLGKWRLCMRKFPRVRSEARRYKPARQRDRRFRRGNDASAVGVPTRDNGAADPANGLLHQCERPLRGYWQAVMRCNTLIPAA